MLGCRSRQDIRHIMNALSLIVSECDAINHTYFFAEFTKYCMYNLKIFIVFIVAFFISFYSLPPVFLHIMLLCCSLLISGECHWIKKQASVTFTRMITLNLLSFTSLDHQSSNFTVYHWLLFSVCPSIYCHIS